MADFILVEHLAKRAGKHYDIRFEKPSSSKWASFACRTIPKNTGTKVLAIKTNDHSKRNALFTGTIKSGQYGAGTLTKIDGGKCDVIKFTVSHIVVDFKGTLLKGIYHFVNTHVIRKSGDRKNQEYLLFKGKIK
jgi:bifunctional non-homologous end joining protein LigD